MFLKVERVKALFKLEAEARMKALDSSSPPKDFIEAFLLQREEVKSLFTLHVYYCGILCQ